MGNGKRLLFFDLLRIGSVAAIVLLHVAMINNWPIIGTLNLVFNIFYLNPGIIGVYVLIFVSGAVLEYSHPKLSTLNELAEFYVKRLFRIYPALWMSLIIGLAVAPIFLTFLTPFGIFLEFIGFKAISGVTTNLFINPVSWFIGLIVVLYFLYPFFSASIRKYPYQMLFLIAFVEIFLRYFSNFYHLGFDRWFPACNFLEFGLGIWIVQQDFYPKLTHDNQLISFLAEISFPVFLVHYVILKTVLISPLFYLADIAVLSWLVMLGDQKIQQASFKKVGVRMNLY